MNKVIFHGTLLLFVANIKIVPSFEVGSLNFNLAVINDHLKPPGNWCSKWLLKSPAAALKENGPTMDLKPLSLNAHVNSGRPNHLR